MYVVQQILTGGAYGGPLSIRYKQISTNEIHIIPDPGLAAVAKGDWGAVVGAVTYEPTTTVCMGTIFARHGSSATFSAPVTSLSGAIEALKTRIALVDFNPMMVKGYDDVGKVSPFPPDLSPTRRRRHDYSLEWGDRLGSKINEFVGCHAVPTAIGHKANRRRAQKARVDLEKYCDQARDRILDGSVPLGDVEGDRVSELVKYGRGLLAHHAQTAPQHQRRLTPEKRRDLIIMKGMMGGQSWRQAPRYLARR